MAKNNQISLQEALEAGDEAATQAVAKPKPRRKPRKKARKIETGETVVISGHFAPEVRKQLRLIGAEEERTTQDMMAEMIDWFFKKKAKSSIKDL